ncbi:MAG: hypothetical protein NT169_21450 [Chloroflexi bacterium]|nr:hypothetical protein [Chloroflexota bacterium]
MLTGLSLLVIFLAGCGAPQQAKDLALTEAMIGSWQQWMDPCVLVEQNCKDYRIEKAAKIPLTPAARANGISQSWSFTVCWIQRDIYGKFTDDCTWLFPIIVHRMDGSWCLDQNSCTKVYTASGQVERKDCCPR